MFASCITPPAQQPLSRCQRMNSETNEPVRSSSDKSLGDLEDEDDDNSDLDTRELSVDDAIYDLNQNTDVYVRHRQKSFVSVKGKKKKLDRVYNIVHACFFLQATIHQHPISPKHCHKPQIQQIKELQ